MKRITLFLLFGLSISLFAASQISYDALKAEIIANKLKEGKTLTVQEANQASDFVVFALAKTQTKGNDLLDDIPAGSEWRKFHYSFESIEREYKAAYVILKKVDTIKKLMSESKYAQLTIAIRDYKDWYSRFCEKQRKYTDCPY